jgi:flagellin-like protein
LRRNRRALSPIFATLIVLAIVTTLFIPVFIWAASTTSNTQDSWQQSGQTATERIIIEEANLQGGQSSCTVYIRNIGQTTVTINDILISLANGTGTIHSYEKSDSVYSCTPTSTVQGQLFTVVISNLGFTPKSGVAYSIQAFTTRGVSDTFQVVA